MSLQRIQKNTMDIKGKWSTTSRMNKKTNTSFSRMARSDCKEFRQSLFWFLCSSCPTTFYIMPFLKREGWRLHHNCPKDIGLRSSFWGWGTVIVYVTYLPTMGGLQQFRHILSSPRLTNQKWQKATAEAGNLLSQRPLSLLKKLFLGNVTGYHLYLIPLYITSLQL